MSDFSFLDGIEPPYFFFTVQSSPEERTMSGCKTRASNPARLSGHSPARLLALTWVGLTVTGCLRFGGFIALCARASDLAMVGAFVKNIASANAGSRGRTSQPPTPRLVRPARHHPTSRHPSPPRRLPPVASRQHPPIPPRRARPRPVLRRRRRRRRRSHQTVMCRSSESQGPAPVHAGYRPTRPEDLPAPFLIRGQHPCRGCGGERLPGLPPRAPTAAKEGLAAVRGLPAAAPAMAQLQLQNAGCASAAARAPPLQAGPPASPAVDSRQHPPPPAPAGCATTSPPPSAPPSPARPAAPSRRARRRRRQRGRRGAGLRSRRRGPTPRPGLGSQSSAGRCAGSKHL